MKRRGFLAGLLGLPFAAMAAKRGLSNADLKKIAEQNPPPPEWFSGQSDNPCVTTGTGCVTSSEAQWTIWNPDGTVATGTTPVHWSYSL